MLSVSGVGALPSTLLGTSLGVVSLTGHLLTTSTLSLSSYFDSWM
jgi:hypothetical protein